MKINVFRSKSIGPLAGFTHLKKNLAGTWYFQVWVGKTHLVIGNSTKR